MRIKFKKLYPTALLPRYGHDDSANAGIDMYACLRGEDGHQKDFLWIPPMQGVTVPLGVAWEPSQVGPHKKAVLILKGRSGLAKKFIEAANSGVIDEGYRGEISAVLYNNSDKPFIVQNGDKIIQGIPFSIPEVEIEEAATLTDSTRGDRGFGSSGM